MIEGVCTFAMSLRLRSNHVGCDFVLIYLENINCLSIWKTRALKKLVMGGGGKHKSSWRENYPDRLLFL